jgi:hypothetical protein
MRAKKIPRAAIGLILVLTSAGVRGQEWRKLESVPYSAVRITDAFWSPKIAVNQKVSLRAALRECEKSGNIANFKIAAGWIQGEHKGSHAYDSDVYKVIEGAAYSLRIKPDPELEALIDGVIEAIAAAQQKDGYLNTYFIAGNHGPRWTMAPTEHELYCAGHLFEAGVAYRDATGKRKLLDVAIRFADHIDSIFGPGKRYEVPGHQEIELALVKLWQATGEKRYLDLAEFFLGERGYAHGREHRALTPEESVRQNTVDPNNRRSIWSTRKYRQDHLPLAEQTEATGHAVRAGYMYAAMADVAGLGAGPGYSQALDRLWDNVVGAKLYITGGVGTAEFGDEGFGRAYNLPNDKAYCETCAAAANIFWNSRMNLLHADAKYVDVLELALYNGFLSGVSQSGDLFFYQNPLASSGKARRDTWSDPACCPSNVVRVIPQVGGYLYARDPDGIYVNLYAGSTADIPWKDGTIRLVQTTRYPWDGNMRISVEPVTPHEFTLNLRIPGWAGDGPVKSDLYAFEDISTGDRVRSNLTINGRPLANPELKNGYLRIRRTWKKGDAVELNLPMPVRRVRAHRVVEADRGRVALMRGPVVFCLENADNPFEIKEFGLSAASPIKADYRGSLLGGVTVLQGQGTAGGKATVDFMAVPYYAWANRGQGWMTVWIPESETEK